MTVVEWRLDSDRSTRWQVMCDLTHEPADVVAVERSKVASEGWGCWPLESPHPSAVYFDVW